MAARSGGVGGMLYSLVIFVFLFVISLGLAILFFTQKADLEGKAKSSEETARRFVSEEQKTNPYFKLLEKEAQDGKVEGSNIFARVLIRKQNIFRQLTGSGDDNLEKVTETLKQMNVTGGKSLLSELKQTQDSLASAQLELAQLTTGDEDRNKAMLELQDKYDQLVQAIQQQDGNRMAQIDQLRNAQADYEQKSDDERNKLVQQGAVIQTETRQKLQTKDKELRGKDRSIAQLRQRIDALQAIIEKGRPGAPNQLLVADGEIVGVQPDENLVYIDLGKKDRITLGMTFEIFDGTAGIKLEEEDANGDMKLARGKASIEVIRILENTAVCRIVRLGYNQQVLAKDLITNLAYDKKRIYKFYVFGNFDLNYDGKTEPSDYDLVVSMIRQWGGVVSEGDTLPLDVDFLILGVEPQTPRSAGDQFDPEVVRQIEARRKVWEKYHTLGAQARDMKVPVLNQNRFLSLVGQ